jgi:hypothetical protein
VIGGPGGTAPDGPDRRLALTPIGLDVAVALAHTPDGIRLSALASAIGSPVSSVQAALRILVANGLARRVDVRPPRYALAPHPACDALVALGLAFPEAAHALAVVVRASPAVAYAAVDADGFIIGIAAEASKEDRGRLEASIREIGAARPDAPPVETSSIDELGRLARVSVGLRTRLDSAVTIRGALERPGQRSSLGTAARADRRCRTARWGTTRTG